MSRIGALLARHLIHTATITPRQDGAVDADGHPAGGYGDPVAGVRCRLVDLDDAEIADQRQAGATAFTDALLLPLSAAVAIGAKVSDVALAADGSAVDDGIFAVVDVATANAATPEFRRARLARTG